MASGLWESERQRAALYVERRKRERAALHAAVFRRVNAHAAFAEHAVAHRRVDDERRREREQEIDMGGLDGDSDGALAHDADADGEDLALDFLGDVDADDMRTLLVEHAPPAATTAPAVVSAAIAPAVAVPPVVAMALAPLSMPTHLLSTAKAASVMTTAMAGVAVGISMGEDAGVSELMDELQIDVHSLAASTTTTATTTSTTASMNRSRDCDGEEHKTEDSTPPRHVLEQRVQRANEEATHTSSPSNASASVKRPIGGALETVWKDVFDPVAAAADEMITWVTGNNDPEVIKRRETLRGDKKRRVTKRFGTDTFIDQASIRRVAKYQAGEGDSSSSSSDEVKSDSDFSPQEIVEIEEDEEEEEPFSETELLVEDDERRKPAARRRIRQRPRTKMTIKKVSQKTIPGKRIKRVKRTEREDRREETTKESRQSKRNSRTIHDEEQEDEMIEMEPHDQDEPQAIQAIDLRSESEAEPEPDTTKDASPTGEKEKASSPLVKDANPGDESDIVVSQAADAIPYDEEAKAVSQCPVSQTAEEPDTTSRTTKSDCVVKLKISSQEFEKLKLHASVVEVAPANFDQPSAKEKEGAVPNPPSPNRAETMEDDGYGTDQIDVVSAEGANDSDTGTLDLENEEMLSQLDEDSKGSPTSTSGGAANGMLNPVEPQVKMSPQHSTPPSNARALKPESPESKGTAHSEMKTVEFEEVSSDVDFGSGESEDFTGDGVINLASDDEETEFGQFFESTHKKQARPSPHSPEQDATPVKKIRAEVPAPASSSSPALPEAKPAKTARSPERGSNGLRKVPNINTTTVSKGRYKQTRHAIRLLDNDMKVTNPEPTAHDPKRNLVERSRFFGAGPPPSGEVSPRTIRPLVLRRTMSADNEMAGGDRYLKYDRTVIQPRTTRKEEFKNAAKQARERFDRRANNSTSKASAPASAGQNPSVPVVAFDATPVGTGTGVLKPLEGMMTSDGKFVTPREPQMTIYDATGAISQYDDDAPLSASLHKRPSKFVKEIDEAKRQGVDVRRGKPEELDPKAKIPKKSSHQLALERSSNGDRMGTKYVKEDKHTATSPPKSKRAKTGKHADTSDRPSKYAPPSQSSSESKRSKSSKNSSSSGPSHYGPREGDSSQRRQDEYQSRKSGGSSSRQQSRSLSPSSKSRDRGDRERSHGGRDDGRRRNRDRERDSGHDRRHDRSRSPFDSRYRDRRTPSPPHRSSRDHHSRSHRHSRSRSRSRSTSRSLPSTEHRRAEEKRQEGRSHERDPRSVTSYASAENISESMKDDRTSDSSLKQQPRSTVLSSREVRMPGALAAFDSGEGSEIAESDVEFVDDFEEDLGSDTVFDIRYNLADVKIDDELRRRMVYVCNLSPQVDEEELTKLFEEFGIAEHEDIGCPAVEVFMCQRSHRPRGDARVTFTSSEAVALAVERLEASISSNSRLTVRPMDDHTMRVLQVQFDTFRDTWLCSDPYCRAETSYWARVCSKCNRRRVFPPSNVKIGPKDWLCSICFAINASHGEKCTSCDSILPPLTDGGHNRARPRNGRYD